MNYLGPNSLFFPPYIMSAIIFSVIWIKLNSKQSWKDACEVFFSRQVWFSNSAFIDFQFSLLIILIVGYFLAPLQRLVFDQSLNTSRIFLSKIFDTTWSFNLPYLYEGILATLVTMFSIDFASYIMHRWMHRYYWLRKIHLIHHSAAELNFFTTYRQHILEPIILNTSRTIFAAIGLSILHLFFKSQTPVITYKGLGIGFFIYMFTVNLHHSHIPVCYPRPFRYIFISPHIHHLHHSIDPRHANKNLGVVFSIWDRLFGTYLDEDVGLNQLGFGIINLDEKISIKHSWQLRLKFKSRGLPSTSAT